MKIIYVYVLGLILAGCGSNTAIVGVTDFEVIAVDGGPAFNSRVWYPGTGGEARRFGASRIRPGYLAATNGTVSLSSQAPLIVLNHGSGGSAESTAWLATKLANAGALVIAADHPASSGGNPERASIMEVWTQPGDVSQIIDQFLLSDWRNYIDTDRIAVVGFSLGGTTAMSLAGMRLQFEQFPLFCETHDDGACRAFRQHFASIDDRFLARANADLSESRIRAAVAIAPAFVETATTDSLSSLQVPVLVVAGELDQQLPPETHARPFRQFLPGHSRYLEVSGAQHFSFLPICGDDAIEVLAETEEEFVCQEFGDKSRAEIHQETFTAIEEFLLANDILNR